MNDTEQSPREALTAAKSTFGRVATHQTALALQKAQNRFLAHVEQARSDLVVIEGDAMLASIPEEYSTTAALQHILETIKGSSSNATGTLLYVSRVAEQALKAAGRG